MGSTFGVCCSRDSTVAASEEVAGAASVQSEREDAVKVEQSDWERLGGGELEPPLRDGLVRCVDSRYLIGLCRGGGRIECMQDLPDSAFISLEELKQLGARKKDFWEPSKTTYEWLPIAILSYSWLGRAHPDPHGETLTVLVRALELMDPLGVIVDFTSLPQAPRTEEQGKRFKSGLQTFNIFYSHPHTLVLQVTKFPAGYPSARSYDLPEGCVPAEYQQRGWCFAEACISSLGKTPKFLCNLSLLPQNAKEVVGRCTNTSAPPPLSPSAFNEELSTKVFTQKKTDLVRVQKLYEDAFNSRIREARSLMFAGLLWGPVEIRTLAKAMEKNQQVCHLDLSINKVGDEGCSVLSQVIEVHDTLRSLVLAECGIGAAGARFLGETLRANGTLTELNLRNNKIGAEGAGCLGAALKVNTTLTKLTLSSYTVDADGLRMMEEGLKVNTRLTDLDISVSSLGSEGARSLAEVLRVNNALTTLNLTLSRIRSEGAAFLAEALKVNTTLTTLYFQENEGAESLVEAARPGCQVIWQIR